MNKIDRLQKAISQRQAELHRVADTLARSAYTLRRRGAVLRVLLIAFGALTAAQGTVDQLQAVPAGVSGVVFLALGVSIAALAGIETAFKFESRGAELNALAATCHSMVRQTDTAWHRKVGLEADPEQQARGAMELIELQDTKLQEVQEKAATAGVDITLEVRRPFRKSLRNVGRDDDDDDDDQDADDDAATPRGRYLA